MTKRRVGSTVAGRASGGITQVELAGRLVAWTEDRSSGIQRWLVVRDAITNREVARIHSRRFVGGRSGYGAST